MMARLFPAYAGVIPSQRSYGQQRITFPRMCGVCEKEPPLRMLFLSAADPLRAGPLTQAGQNVFLSFR